MQHLCNDSLHIQLSVLTRCHAFAKRDRQTLNVAALPCKVAAAPVSAAAQLVLQAQDSRTWYLCVDNAEEVYSSWRPEGSVISHLWLSTQVSLQMGRSEATRHAFLARLLTSLSMSSLRSVMIAPCTIHGP